MHQSEEEHLIDMINHIAMNNLSVGDESAVAQMIEGHIRKFWPRRMKAMLCEYIARDGSELHPAARLAGTRLSEKGA